MEQFQCLLSNIALGLKRFETELEMAKAIAPDGHQAEQPTERARKTTLRIATASNRSSWCSCCEMATFIKTGALARKTYLPIAIFLSRPLYLYEECRRLLQLSHEILIDIPNVCENDTRPINILCFDASASTTSGANSAANLAQTL
jgi:hypothetical protein